MSLLNLGLLALSLPLAHGRSIQLQKRDLTVFTLGGWTSLGCWSDSQASRTLSLMAHSGQHVSDDNCQYQCTQLGYNYAGVEYSGQCYCDNWVNPIATQEPDTDCNMPCTGVPSQPCGGPDRMNLFWNGVTAPPPPVTITNPGVEGFVSEGCYTDSVAARTLANRVATSGGGSVMTIDLCVSACKAAGYSLAGAEFGGECYCDNQFANGGPASDQTICSMKCNGDSTNYCGGPGAMNLYSLNGATPVSVAPTSTTPVPSATVVLPSAWATLGCYTDTNGQRALTNFIAAPNTGMTVEFCISACASNGYSIAGVEYGGECYCDNSFKNNHGLAPDGSTGCNMACTGEAGETCGGPNRLNAFAAGPAWVQLGCYSDQVYQRTLANLGAFTGDLTIEKCLASCSTAGYSLAGVEYGVECHCGNSFDNGGGPAPDGSVGCSFPCAGNSAEICGGSNRLSMYEYINAAGVVATTPVASVTPTPTPSPVVASLPSGWTSSGCYIDNAYGRILSVQQPNSDTLTIESCIATCSGLGYTIAGLEYSTQCFCGNSIIAGGLPASAASDCAMPCSGNSAEICGGPARMSIYAAGAVTTAPVPVVQTTGLPGTWSYSGCVSDNVGARTLPYEIDFGTTNSATTCLTQCTSLGYTVGGMEYGAQCFCGQPADFTASGATTSTNCNMVCSGDASGICGGPGAITYYTS
ncbi:WSC-domain-containing protein [Lepidopterella palustris CBS 459.81]|uniref:WSC-domain-containing protein n=1 Tax=Lepidopterella palustris CBS 459.81 TaxID=1314670 RepID=A0A8E2EMW5_9PEZI|nr:WSC-domain-containing protein [Lepidopterella palustris CBS 459.81]